MSKKILHIASRGHDWDNAGSSLASKEKAVEAAVSTFEEEECEFNGYFSSPSEKRVVIREATAALASLKEALAKPFNEFALIKSSQECYQQCVVWANSTSTDLSGERGDNAWRLSVDGVEVWEYDFFKARKKTEA